MACKLLVSNVRTTVAHCRCGGFKAKFLSVGESEISVTSKDELSRC